jgi:hypothetical protein
MSFLVSTLTLMLMSMLMLWVVDIKGHLWWEESVHTKIRTRFFGLSVVTTLLFVVTVLVMLPILLSNGL